MQLINKKKLGIVLLLIATIFVAGCAKQEDGDKNKQTIQAVIEQVFNGPDKEYRELWNAMEKVRSSEKYLNNFEEFLQTPERQAVINHVKETYGKYFTEEQFNHFTNMDAYKYSMMGREYSLKTANIDIKQSKNSEKLYDFSFQVVYTDKLKNETSFEFQGNAIMTEEGKIAKIGYIENDGNTLMDKINESPEVIE